MMGKIEFNRNDPAAYKEKSSSFWEVLDEHIISEGKMQNIDQVSNIISGTTGTSKELREFLSDKVFEVPSYQRNYAWDYDNCLDLWNDIHDGRKNKIPHYWGTITLKKTDRKQKASIATSLKVYEVIDGQQRLTTLHLLLLASSQKGILDLKDTFLKINGIHKLRLSTLNERRRLG